MKEVEINENKVEIEENTENNKSGVTKRDANNKARKRTKIK